MILVIDICFVVLLYKVSFYVGILIVVVKFVVYICCVILMFLRFVFKCYMV